MLGRLGSARKMGVLRLSIQIDDSHGGYWPPIAQHHEGIGATFSHTGGLPVMKSTIEVGCSFVFVDRLAPSSRRRWASGPLTSSG